MVQANPQLPVTLVEKRLLVPGHAHEMMHMGHDHAGSLLMEHWQMPPHVVITCREHHNHAYHGPFNEIANLVYVTDCLLQAHDIGDADTDEISPEVIENLKLSNSMLEEFRQEAGQLVSSANEMESILVS